jgi:hypothetical protein
MCFLNSPLECESGTHVPALHIILYQGGTDATIAVIYLHSPSRFLMKIPVQMRGMVAVVDAAEALADDRIAEMFHQLAECVQVRARLPDQLRFGKAVRFHHVNIDGR